MEQGKKLSNVQENSQEHSQAKSQQVEAPTGPNIIGNSADFEQTEDNVDMSEPIPDLDMNESVIEKPQKEEGKEEQLTQDPPKKRGRPKRSASRSVPGTKKR